MVTRPRRGLTLPELLAMTLVAAAIIGTTVVITQFGAKASQDLEASALIDGSLSNVTSIWVRDGTIPGSVDLLSDLNPRHYTVAGHVPVNAAEAADTVSVALISGRSGAVGVAARSASGDCWLSRLEVGDGASPQRYGVIETGEDVVCSGRTALTLNVASDAERDGGSWAGALRLTSVDP